MALNYRGPNVAAGKFEARIPKYGAGRVADPGQIQVLEVPPHVARGNGPVESGVVFSYIPSQSYRIGQVGLRSSDSQVLEFLALGRVESEGLLDAHAALRVVHCRAPGTPRTISCRRLSCEKSHALRIGKIRYYDAAGVRKQVSSGKTDYEEALKEAGRLEGEVQTGKRVARKRKTTLHELCQDVVNDYRVNGKKSLKDIKSRFNLHILPFFVGIKAAAVTTSHIREYIAVRQEEGASNGTINRELTAIKRAFSLANQEGKSAYRPHIPMLKEAPPKSGFFEEEEFLKLRAALPDYLQGFVTFGYITGWRLAEVQNLKWENVDFAGGEVRLFVGTTKNDGGRVFPMIGELRSVLEHAKRDSPGLTPYVFTYTLRKIVRPIGGFRKTWVSACLKVGIPCVVEKVDRTPEEKKAGKKPYKRTKASKTFHDFRRTAVRRLVRSGVPERVAMQMTGHKTRSVFDRYHIVSPSDLADAATKLGDFLGDSGKLAGGMVTKMHVTD